MTRRTIMCLIVALALVACGAGGSTPTGPAQGTHVIASDSKLLDTSTAASILKPGDIAPDFEYTLGDGTMHTLSQLRGKRVLINFWATWCGPCRSEMPDLQKALGDYGDSVIVLGVNKIEHANVIAPFADELGIGFPLITNTQGDISDRYGARLLPTSYFLNSDGTIAFRQIGVMNYTFIKMQIDQLK
jgi:thiol-disulfide isomerase/thioredoxin